MRTRSRIAGLVSIAALAGYYSVSTALSTTLVRLSLEQMSQASTAIVRGRVVSQETLWNPQHTEIITSTAIEVEDVFKGQPSSTLIVEQLGGTIGNLHEYVAGTVHFRPQASYLLFLEPAGEDSTLYRVVGMAQGAYRIYQDAITHEERVVRPLGNVFYAAAAKPSEGTAPLKQFDQEVTAALRAPLVIPAGTALAVRVETAPSRGVGRLALLARTTSEVYPSPTLVIPVGSEVQGTAERVAGVWRIHWTDVSIRGRRVPIAAASKEPARESLGGKLFVVTVR